MELEKAATLPRGEDPMRGLWPASGYLRYVLSEPVITDEQAEELAALDGYLEGRQAVLDRWYRAGCERIAKAVAAMHGSPAYLSLADYVRANPTKKGGKSLNTASGEIKLRKQKNILRVYDEKLAAQSCPEALYTYQAPAVQKLGKDKLKAIMEKSGEPLTFPGADGQAVLIAEIIPEIETLQITHPEPSGEMEGDAIPPRLLEEMRKEEVAANENPSQPATVK